MPSILKKKQQIIAASNDYLITVKDNQQTLLTQLKNQFEQLPSLSGDRQSEQNRDRFTHRSVSVLDQVPASHP